MKSFLLLILLGAGLGFGSELHAHGGTYKGPEDTVPPGGGGLSSPPTPVAPPGKSSTPPGTSDPSRPTPPGSVTPPSDPPSRNPGGPPAESGGGALPLSDHSGWQYWWEFNKDRFLNLRAKVQDVGPRTEVEGILAGLNGAQARTSSLVNEGTVRDKILPALYAAARSTDDVDLLTGTMIAIARIGRDVDSAAAELFTSQLDSPSQEIAETAAICFGILKDPSALKLTLPALIFDDAAGRVLVGGHEVPARTRAFAAYAAGLIGEASNDSGVQALVAEMLLRLLETDRSAVVDLRVAAVLGIGLLHPDDPALTEHLVLALSSRLAAGRDDALVLAHHPTTLAKLLRGAPAGLAARERVLDQLLLLARPRTEAHGLVRQSAVMALGMLARAGDPRSAEIFDALLEMRERGRDQQAKNFTAIAMAYLGAAAPDFDSEANKYPVTRFLLENLRKSDSSYEGWSALSLGVLGFLRRENGAEIAPFVYEAVLNKFERARAPDLLGACAISLGLLLHGSAAPQIAEKMDRLGEPGFLGYGAVALGLLGAHEQGPRLLTLLDSQRRDPELVRQAATGLGLLRNAELRGALLALLAPPDGTRPSLPVLAASAVALGFVGDARSVDPLLGVLGEERRFTLARAFAGIALGLLADKEWLPWNAPLAEDLNYGAAVSTLIEKSSANGILDLL